MHASTCVRLPSDGKIRQCMLSQLFYHWHIYIKEDTRTLSSASDFPMDCFQAALPAIQNMLLLTKPTGWFVIGPRLSGTFFCLFLTYALAAAVAVITAYFIVSIGLSITSTGYAVGLVSIQIGPTLYNNADPFFDNITLPINIVDDKLYVNATIWYPLFGVVSDFFVALIPPDILALTTAGPRFLSIVVAPTGQPSNSCQLADALLKGACPRSALQLQGISSIRADTTVVRLVPGEGKFPNTPWLIVFLFLVTLFSVVFVFLATVRFCNPLLVTVGVYDGSSKFKRDPLLERYVAVRALASKED